MILATQLKANDLLNPTSLTPGLVTLSWIPIDAKQQSAYEVIGKISGDIVFHSGKVVSSNHYYTPTFQISGSTQMEWEVTLWDEKDIKGEVAYANLASIPHKSSWIAKWIDPEKDVINESVKTRLPASYLLKKFHGKAANKAILYATAHGVYDIYLNGNHLKGWMLAPMHSQYDKRLMVQAYDVTEYLKEDNEILVSLGDGWYRGSVGNSMDINTFGTDLAFLAQLEVDGEILEKTDETWVASNNGPLGLNDFMKGEEYDARKENIELWHDVTIKDYGYDNLIGSDCQPILAQEKFKPILIHTPSGETVLDFGQNFAGFVEFDLVAKEGDKIILTHGETLDANGNFTISNFQNPRKPECYQKITYICKEGKNSYHPTKCYFGFRYVKVETDLLINEEEFTGVAIYSDMMQTGYFTCGNSDVNQLFSNTLWSMKSNFVGVPTDCPTREKSGFTGDAQIFCDTALYLMDSYPVYRQWLLELSASAFEDGGLRQVAPDKRNPGMFEKSSGWCDAIEIIPWKLWRRTGNLETAKDNYETIKNWLMFSIKRGENTREANKSLLNEELWPYFMDQGFHWGEWLEPGVNTVETIKNNMMNGEPEVATAYLAYGCKLASELAKELGKSSDTAYFAKVSEMATEAYRKVFVENGKLQSERQCLYVRPIALGLLQDEENILAARKLAENIRDNGNHLNTGFLSTGEICPVLTEWGQVEVAYDLLLQPNAPSWLYEVKKGATTVWENWNGVGEDGSIRDSMNHYAYGAVCGWLLKYVGGISVELDRIYIKPYPDKRIGYAKVAYHSPLGIIRSEWSYQGDCIKFIVEIPCDGIAEVTLPDGRVEIAKAGIWEYKI